MTISHKKRCYEEKRKKFLGPALTVLLITTTFLFFLPTIQALTLTDAVFQYNGENFPASSYVYHADNTNGTNFNVTLTDNINIQTTKKPINHLLPVNLNAYAIPKQPIKAII